MIGFVLLALVGCVLGVITGLTPGLHVNTITLLGLSLFPIIGITPMEFSVAMIAMAITHTFLDFIPAIFIGVPEEETALSILPTHQLLLQGKSLEAVKLTAYGSLFGLFFALLFLIPALLFVPIIYNLIRSFVVYLLMIAVLFLILREREPRRRVWATIIFFISGFLGFLSLNLKVISSTQVLFPIFSGLFGLSTILYSLKTVTKHIPQEEFAVVKFDKGLISGGFLGSLGGVLVGILPAMSPSQIGILMFEILGNNLRSFLVSVSAINTSDAIFSLVSLYTIHNARSGVATMIGKIIEIDLNTLILFIGVISFTAVFALVLHLEIGKLAMRFVGKVNYRLMSIFVFFIVVFLVYWITGVFGVLLALLSMCIGLLPILSGVSRTHSMGVLILPTIMYFLGMGL